MKKYIPYALIVLLLSLVVYQWLNNPTGTEQFVEEQMNKSQTKVDSLNRENVVLLQSIRNQEFKIDSLSAVIDVLEKQATTINIIRDEKIKNVDRLTPGELQQYFTDNYPGNHK